MASFGLHIFYHNKNFFNKHDWRITYFKKIIIILAPTKSWPQKMGFILCSVTWTGNGSLPRNPDVLLGSPAQPTPGSSPAGPAWALSPALTDVTDTYKGELSRPGISSYEASNEILGSWWTEGRPCGQAGSNVPRGHNWKRGRERAHSLFLFPPNPSSLSGLSGAAKVRWNHSHALSNHWELFLVLIFQDYQWVSGTAGSRGAWMEFITGCRPRAEHKRFSLDVLQKETHLWAVMSGLRNRENVFIRAQDEHSLQPGPWQDQAYLPTGIDMDVVCPWADEALTLREPQLPYL